MKKNITICVVVVVSMLIMSCKVEFSPNTTWREVPSVYCLLDQDDDTTYVRVQKCYLGDGNAYDYTRVYDSINYPEGSIKVQMQEWNATAEVVHLSNDAARTLTVLHPTGTAPRRTFDFDYMLVTDKDSGLFATSEGQPVYVCRTSGQLDSTCVYYLVVTKSNGDTIATAHTQLLWGSMRLINPNNGTKFDFTGSNGNKRCLFRFSPLEGGRRYQPMIRFYYRDYWLEPNETNGVPDTFIVPHYIDIDAGYFKSDMKALTEEYSYAQGAFLSAIKMKLAGDTLEKYKVKNVIDTVDIWIRVCDENLTQYLYSHEVSSALNQSNYTFTNIQGGVGVFAARRTRIKFTIPSPAPVNSPYKQALAALKVGFSGQY